MTFGKARYKNKQSYELLRYCSKHTVVGGASKLFKHFLKIHNPISVLSYADRCWSTGDLYTTLGFADITKDPMNVGYFFVKKNIRFHRLSLTKQILVNSGADPTKTADKILEDKGYSKIFNCGNYKFVYQNIA